MSHYTNRLFWINALDRAIRTFAQALLAFIGADSIGILDADWVTGASVAGMAAILSVLMSIATPDSIETGTIVPAYQPRHVAEPDD